MFCNLTLGIGILMLYDAWVYGHEISEVCVFFIVAGASSIILTITFFIRRLCVPCQNMVLPMGISLIPSLLMLLMPSDFVLLGSFVGILILIILWAHKKYQTLPTVLGKIDNQINHNYPRIQDKGIGRISEKRFLVEMNAALEQIPKKEFTEELLNAISDWYTVYIGFAFSLEGMFLGVGMKILFSVWEIS